MNRRRLMAWGQENVKIHDWFLRRDHRQRLTSPGLFSFTLAADLANGASLCGRALALLFRLCVAFGAIVLTMGDASRGIGRGKSFARLPG